MATNNKEPTTSLVGLSNQKQFNEKFNEFKKNWTEKAKRISEMETPKSVIKKRPDGFDYVEEGLMRDILDREYPGWSWLEGKVQFLGNFWIVVTGTLRIVDENLAMLHINPPYREFHGVGSARIQYKSKVRENGVEIAGEIGNPFHIIDIDKNVKSANANAFKYAVNRLTRICDDVYGKQSELGITIKQSEKLSEIIEKYSEFPEVKKMIEDNYDKINNKNFNGFMKKLQFEIGKLKMEKKEKEQ